jgi:serine/threonine protein kinase
MTDDAAEPPATAEDAHDEGRLDELVAQGLDRLESEGEPGFERFLADHREEAPRIRSRVDALRDGGLLEPVKAPLDLEIPEQLGAFRLLRCLGSGGMGVVYLAEQEGLRRLVALKMLLPAHLFFPHARERFRREVEIVARLNHPGIVPIYMVGEDRGLPYFAMECVDGCSLGELLRSAKGRDPASLSGADLRALIRELAHGAAAEGTPAPVSPAQETIDDVFAARVFSGSWADAALRLLEQVAAALAHAHARGVLHRDVKPSNIMVRADGRAQLVDFGLALLEGSSKITRSGHNPGSLPYMSPEQLDAARGEPDVRSDVYSLGVTLYELLTLQSAFDSPSREVTTRRILEGDAPPVRRFQPRIGSDVETVCATAMASEKGRRYATAADFARDLEAARERRPISAKPPSLAWSAWRRVRRHPVRVVAAAAVLLAFATFVLTSLSDRSITQSAANLERARGRAQDAAQRVMRAIITDKQDPAPEDLALLESEIEDPKFTDKLAFLRQSPFDAKVWDELEKSIEPPNPAAKSGITLLQPLAGTTDLTPNFIFDPVPGDDRDHSWTVVIARDGQPLPSLHVDQKAGQSERLQVEIPDPGLSVGDYTWCVRREDRDAKPGAAPIESSVAHFTVVDKATIQSNLDTIDRLRESDPELANVAKLMSAATYLRYRCAKEALQELAVFPPDAPPENHSYRLLLEAHAHAILVDAESLEEMRKEAEALRPRN